MVKINKIYTRTGDNGTTGLTDGSRRSKGDLRIEAYGVVDETNACIGLARVHTQGFDAGLDAFLGRIQNDLFDLGADLSMPEQDKPLSYEPLRIVASQVQALEAQIDHYTANMKPLTSFVLNGGSPAAAHLHLARTVARRAERLVVSLAAVEPVNPEAIRYINRLSDFLFVAARLCNDNGNSDVLWVPGKNR
ncbi:cob(I)yrinic acid a,c-diamide adenosyltransferase [Salmonella enterica subsp. enterica]|nr:cob(I)yrinic acid a,c-diamide adenosyltransferase [Salmonella enterica subsp. enterica serovar Enteritidis]